LKKVMVHAYLHFNLGDDLFVKILSERYPNIKFYVYAPKNYITLFKKNKNIKVIPINNIILRGINFIFRKLFKINIITLKLIRNSCDAVIHIGGSLFIQGEEWKKELNRTRSMHVKGKPVFLLGSNFGPFFDEEFYNEHREMFRKYTDICFREEYSYNLFRSLSNVRFADDIVFQLKPKIHGEDENNIVISVIKPSKKNLTNIDEIYYEKIRDISVYFIDRGYTVTLMSFCEYEGDTEAVSEIIELMPDRLSDKILKHYYMLNIDDTLKVIEQASFIIATRFHAMVLGWVYNKPVFPIVYSSKMTNVMKDVGFNGLYSDLDNINNLEPELVFNSKDYNLISVSKQINNSEKQFKILDDYLTKE